MDSLTMPPVCSLLSTLATCPNSYLHLDELLVSFVFTAMALLSKSSHCPQLAPGQSHGVEDAACVGSCSGGLCGPHTSWRYDENRTHFLHQKTQQNHAKSAALRLRSSVGRLSTGTNELPALSGPIILYGPHPTSPFLVFFLNLTWWSYGFLCLHCRVKRDTFVSRSEPREAQITSKDHCSRDSIQCNQMRKQKMSRLENKTQRIQKTMTSTKEPSDVVGYISCQLHFYIVAMKNLEMKSIIPPILA